MTTMPVLETFSCFACSPHNPRGLHLRFEEDGADQIRGTITIDGDFDGLGGVAHGGVVATILDEAMAWTLYRHRRAVFVTARMEQRFRGTVPTGTPIDVTASIGDDGDRRIRMSAEIRAQDGSVLAEGSGLYVRAPERTLEALPAAQRRELIELFERFAAMDEGR